MSVVVLNIPESGIAALINFLNNGSLGVTNSNGIVTATNTNEPLGLIFADNNNIVHLAYYNAEGMVVPVISSAWGKSAVVIPHVIHYIGNNRDDIPDLSSDGIEEKNLVGSATYPTLQMLGDMDGHYGGKDWVKSISDGTPHTLTEQFGRQIRNGTADENTTIETVYGLDVQEQTAGETNIGLRVGGRIQLKNLPTSPNGLDVGDLWNNNGAINIVQV